MKDSIGVLKTCEAIKRYGANPILTQADVPYDSILVYNAGITKFQGKYVMVFRNDYGDLAKQTLSYWSTLGLAFSNDGINWEVEKEPCFQMKSDEIIRAYDPRLTIIENKCYMTFAVDTKHGIRAGIAVTEDFKKFEILSLSVPDNRNMVLFPEKINGYYTRLERPFPVYGTGGHNFDIWISRSPDMKYWGDSELVLKHETVPFCNDKIGPAAPPIKTKYGWLTTFHSVDVDSTRGKNGWEPVWQKRYTGGIMLLDLENPSKVIGIYNQPLIAPETAYEIDGMRGNVVFPGGMILEDNGDVKIYYGAADSVECLATARLEDLVNLCLN